MNHIFRGALRVLLFSAVFWLLNLLPGLNVPVETIDFYWGYPFLCFIAVVHGPVCGAFSGALGMLFVSLRQGGFSWLNCAMPAVNLAAVGLLCRDETLSLGNFGKKEILRYVRTLVFVNFLGWLIDKLAVGLLNRNSLKFAAVPVSVPLIYTLLGVTAGTLLLTLYARAQLSALNFYRS